MTSSGAASSIIKTSILKWQIALVIGAPVALGLGYIYYRNRMKESLKSAGDFGDDIRKDEIKTNKQLSIDGDESSSSKPSENETPLEKAQSYKEKGNRLFSNGKYDEAILKYTKAIEFCGNSDFQVLSVLYQNRAAAYEKLNKFHAAKDDCNKALELNPMYIKALTRRARVLERIKDLQTALEDITAACILEQFSNESSLIFADKLLKQLGRQHAEEYMLTKKPVMPSKHFIKTYFEAFRNDPILKECNSSISQKTTGLEKALESFKSQNYDNIIQYCTEEIEKLDTNDLSDYKMKIHLLRGTFYLLLGEHTKAMSDINLIISNESSSKELRVNALIKRATMHVQLEDTETSFHDFSKAIEIDPDCGDIYHNRAQVNLLLEKIDEAKSDFEKAAKLHPQCGLIFVQKCYADYRFAASKKDIGSIATALSTFQDAFEKFPDCPECYTLYAQMLCDTQEYEKADYYFSKAMEKDPKNATIHVHRGLLHLHWNANVEKAVAHIKNALELDDRCEFGYETLGSIEVQRGNLKEAIALFEKALALGRTKMEVTHIFSLKDAARTQLIVSERLGMLAIKNAQRLA